jgi:hypothetical protein
MLRNLIRTRNLVVLLLPLAICGVALAGDTADCPHMKAAATAAGMEKGAGCDLDKDVKKSAKMTDDGAIVTLAGKTDKAVEHIKSHLGSHEKGEGCKDCPMSMENVKSTIKLNDKGGEITLVGSTPEAIKAVQEWANKPGCCGKHENKTV